MDDEYDMYPLLEVTRARLREVEAQLDRAVVRGDQWKDDAERAEAQRDKYREALVGYHRAIHHGVLPSAAARKITRAVLHDTETPT